MLYHLTRKSDNAKTGPIPVSTSSAETCPPSCPFRGHGCYAASGKLSLHWSRVTDGTRGGTLDDLCATVASLPASQLWRHNQAGDLPGVGEAINAGELAALVDANAGRRGFTYTHKPTDNPENAEAIRAANAGGFTVNLSANTLSHADDLAARGVGPVVAVLPSSADHAAAWESTRKAPAPLSTPQGRPVVVCPATYREDVTCKTCGLCAVASRRVIVGFPAHGARKRAASEVASS